MESIYLWLLIAGATFLAELGHPGFFLFLAISIGSLSAAGIAALSTSILAQLSCFIGGSLVSFHFLRRYTARQKSIHASNAHALIGAHGIVTETIAQDGTGRVRIRGEEWIARSLHNARLEAGSLVQVVRIERTTLIVSLFKQ